MIAFGEGRIIFLLLVAGRLIVIAPVNGPTVTLARASLTELCWRKRGKKKEEKYRKEKEEG